MTYDRSELYINPTELECTQFCPPYNIRYK